MVGVRRRAKVAINQGHWAVRNRWPREPEGSYFWSLEPCDKEGTLTSHERKIYQLGPEAAEGLTPSEEECSHRTEQLGPAEGVGTHVLKKAVYEGM